LIQLSETWVIARRQQGQTHLGDVVETFVSLQACQTKGWPTFEGEQIAGMAKELRDDLLRCGLGQIFRKRVFKLLLLNQPLRRKFVGSRLPTS
jgi:hypothetical protein